MNTKTKKKIAVLVIHGMGSQKSTFADDMIKELNKRVKRFKKNPAEIAWKPIHWANILTGEQEEYFRRANENNDLDWIKFRKLFIYTFGDASAYQKVDAKNTTYNAIHGKIETDVASLYKDELESDTDVPLIILAHSLGGHIMSNYIWDMQHLTEEKPNDLNPFTRMETLSGIITFGCNIPLFTFAYDKVVPITFPPENLSLELKKKAKWHNYYDPDDILAWPLKAIPAYKAINKDEDNPILEDIAINVGWSFLAHGDYWTDNSFTKPVAKFIADFLRQQD